MKKMTREGAQAREEEGVTLPSTRMRACHWFLRLLLPTPMNWLVGCLLLLRRLGACYSSPHAPSASAYMRCIQVQVGRARVGI